MLGLVDIGILHCVKKSQKHFVGQTVPPLSITCSFSFQIMSSNSADWLSIDES